MQGDRSIDLMGYLGQQRIIYIGDRITDTVATNVVAKLLALELQDPEKEISMYINSGGGIPFAIMAIIDTLAIIKCPVSTVALGCCMSQSTLLLAAGTKGRRFSMPNARIMMHQPQGGAQGTIHDVKIQATELNRTMRVIQAMFADFTGLPLERVEEETDRDRFFTPQQAVELGIIDGVL
jgi:ATP-dependent Clp protease, protease subunit